MRNALVLFCIALLHTGEQRSVAITRVPRPDDVVLGCAPPLGDAVIPADSNGRYAPVFPGWGHYSYKVAGSGDSVQFYFDQGLNLYYSYHMLESLASFKEAARRDPKCLMAYWGQALAMGPYYNGYIYKMPAGVTPVVATMVRLAGSAKGRERDLAEAMHKRYPVDSSDSHRSEMNRAYAEAMAALIKKYPKDPDIKALYVDAVMLEHSWDFWDVNGGARPWTQELIGYCDTILRVSPHHPGALHYEIHLVEASGNPEKALPNADLLVKDLPGVAHMVHMSSHMYQRNGLFGKGVEVNQRASHLQEQYDTLARGLGIGTIALTHFSGVGAYCAMNANLYSKGMQQAQQERALLTGPFRARLSNTYLQYLYMLPGFVNVRCGKWREVLAAEAPDSNLHFAVLLDEFAKGMASVRLGGVTQAQAHLDRLIELKAYPELQVRNMPFNAAIDVAGVAEELLYGELLLAVGRKDEAIAALAKAVAAEDALIYREPKDWPISSRQYLGAALLQLGQAEAAERVFRHDLQHNPGNGWALLGLYQSLVRGPQQGWIEAGNCKLGYLKAFADAEERPTAAVY